MEQTHHNGHWFVIKKEVSEKMPVMENVIQPLPGRDYGEQAILPYIPEAMEINQKTHYPERSAGVTAAGQLMFQVHTRQTASGGILPLHP